MNVAELAEELGLDSGAVLRLCRDRGIRASWEQSELSDESVDRLRQALAGATVEPEPVIPPVPAGAAVAAGVATPGRHFASPRPEPDRPAAAPDDPAVPPRTEPAFGSIDGRFAAVPASEVREEAAGPTRKALTPEAPAGFKLEAVSAVALAGWWALRYLPDWDAGRWWVGAVALAVICGLAAFRALTLGVTGLIQVVQFSRARRGRPETAIVIGIASVLLVVASLLGSYDWHALRIPDAYGRLRRSIDTQTSKNSARLDHIRGTLPTGEIDPRGTDITGLKVGQCIDFNDAESLGGTVVACSATHSDEVVGFSEFTGSAYPGESAAALQAKSQCEGPFVAYVGRPSAESRYLLVATYPTEGQWASGSRDGVCLASPPRHEKGSARGADR